MRKKILSKLLLFFLIFLGLSISLFKYIGLTQLGLYAYQNGDYKEALRLWKKAADQGDAEAQYSLGTLYDYGQGVQQNYSKAKELYEKACNGGNARACKNIGLLYLNGKGVQQNYSKAKEFFKKSCDGGYKNGCKNYKILNEQGVQ